MSKVLVLRCCDPDMTSHGGFVWPESGYVFCPDWSPEPVCGMGLHGWLWGVGNLGVSAIWDNDSSVWLVVEVEESEIVDLIGKVKFPRGNVVFCGTREDAGNYIAENGGRGMPVMFASVTAGHGGTATAGNGGTATAGSYGTATAGSYGTATAGHYGTAAAGDHGKAAAGYRGTATAGHHGTATAGNGGTATAGSYGTATAGSYGTATAGDRGTATAGNGGTATAGHHGTATAGDRGTAAAGYRGTAAAGHKGTATAGDGGAATAGDGGTATAGNGGRARAGALGRVLVDWICPSGRRRVAVGYVGECGIEPDVFYAVDSSGNLVKV